MIATFLILILAANTAYADFPRLASIIARDSFLPRQFFNRGTRLVFSNGVLFLAIVASTLIVAFQGDISKLIPLYAFGVFTGFTLSQTGMVRHHLKHREPHWQAGLAINAIGAFTTGLIAIIVVVSKFTEGAWIPAVLIPFTVAGFRAIKRHYDKGRRAVAAARGARDTVAATDLAGEAPVRRRPGVRVVTRHHGGGAVVLEGRELAGFTRIPRRDVVEPVGGAREARQSGRDHRVAADVGAKHGGGVLLDHVVQEAVPFRAACPRDEAMEEGVRTRRSMSPQKRGAQVLGERLAGPFGRVRTVPPFVCA
jgi:hypothetical protein